MNWKVDENIDWKLIPIEVYKFYFEQAEKRLNEELADSEKITNRVYAMLGFLVPTISVIISLFLKFESLKTITQVVICIAIFLCASAFLIVQKLLLKRPIYKSGTEPKDIFNLTFYSYCNVDNQKYLKALYFSEIEQTQHKITENYKINYNRIRTFQWLFHFTILGILLTILASISN